MYNILCYGDSNTWGVNTEDENNRVEIEKRWTRILQRELGEEFYVIEEGLPGRTTVFEDPFGRGRHGEKYLEIALFSHDPIDVLVIMLGTNDMKEMYHASAEDSSWGLERLILKAESLRNVCVGKDFKILVVSPILISETDDGKFYYGFTQNSIEKSKDFEKYFRLIAEKYHCEFLDAAKYAKPSRIDGIHIANEDHEKLGNALTEKVREMILKK